MKKSMVLASAMIFAFSMPSSLLAAGLSCEDLKARIEKKLEGKGVVGYTLTIVSKDTETNNRVVGTCDAGTKKIIYEKSKPKAT